MLSSIFPKDEEIKHNFIPYFEHYKISSLEACKWAIWLQVGQFSDFSRNIWHQQIITLGHKSSMSKFGHSHIFIDTCESTHMDLLFVQC